LNYLAHALLSNGDHGLLVGNFIADHLRGNDLSHLPAGVAEGVRMHRRIDSFTDGHPSFRATKRFFYPGFERYSGILTDIFFDHLLAAEFVRYAGTPLPGFSEKVYSIYRKNSHLLPETSNRFLQYLVSNHLYVSYAELSGIERVLRHLSARIQHGVQLENAIPLFEAGQKDIKIHFDSVMRSLLTEFSGD
jgi:acyl carrier protein phosphodiesterase